MAFRAGEILFDIIVSRKKPAKETERAFNSTEILAKKRGRATSKKFGDEFLFTGTEDCSMLEAMDQGHTERHFGPSKPDAFSSRRWV